jgi:hypothetical protein
VEPSAPKRRQTKKSKKAQSKEQEQEQEADDQEEQEEIIRCVCGASEQDEDSGEAWIGCETCFAWQHNVCVGVSSYEDEIPEHYWCEQCRPENHKELLDGIARGEQPWVERRKAHEEKKRRKGGRKPKAKRVSDAKEDATDKDKETKAKPSPAPEAPAPKEKEATGKGKRKSREDSQDMEGKVGAHTQSLFSVTAHVRLTKQCAGCKAETSVRRGRAACSRSTQVHPPGKPRALHHEAACPTNGPSQGAEEVSSPRHDIHGQGPTTEDPRGPDCGRYGGDAGAAD